MKEAEVLAGEPINGHIVVKVDYSQVKKDLGMPEDSVIELPELHKQAYAGGSSRGMVVKMAADAFGGKYQEKYGSDIVPPKEGDMIHFVPYDNARLDDDATYYLVTDDSVKFIERKQS